MANAATTSASLGALNSTVLDEFEAAITASLDGSVSTEARGQEHSRILTALLNQPRSSLSAAHLVAACDYFLETAVWPTGGGVLAGRNSLIAFDDAITKAASPANAGTQSDTDMIVEPPQVSGGTADEDDDPSRPAIRDEDVQREVLEMTVEKVQPQHRLLAYEDQACTLRLHLADVQESLQDWNAAAQVLQGIRLDSANRSVTDLYKLRIYVRIVRLLLEADDPVGADAYLKRASMVIHTVPGANLGGTIGSTSTSAATEETANPASSSSSSSAAAEDIKEARLLGLQYKLSQAKIYDSQRRFAEAAMRFHELSYVVEIAEEDRRHMLSAAVTAAILAPAGPQRSRILSTLVRDDRTTSLPQSTILSKVFLDQLIRPSEIASFEELLQPHQKALLATAGTERSSAMTGLDEENGTTSTLKSAPTTVLERSVIEHNLLSSSKLYLTITLTGLGLLLGLTPTGVEGTLRRMIQQGRLRARIDGVEEIVYFHHDESNGTFSASGGANASSTNDGSTSTAAAGTGDAADPSSSAVGSAVGAGGGGTSDPSTTSSSILSNPLASTTLLSSTAAYSDTVDGGGEALVARWDAAIARTATALEDVVARIAKLQQQQQQQGGAAAAA